MIVVAPEIERYPIKSRLPIRLFAAGGITGAEDWQSPYCQNLDDLFDDMIIYNPRRAAFDLTDPQQSRIQIKWEYERLKRSDIITFWFSPTGYQQITFLEYGKALVWSHGVHDGFNGFNPVIFVAVHPDFSRRFDVLEQTAHECPGIVVHDSLDALTAQVTRYLDDLGQPRKG